MHYYSIFKYFTWLEYTTYIRDIVVILKPRSWSSVNRRTLKGPCLDSWSSRITRTGWPNRVLNVSHHICPGVQNFFFIKSWFFPCEACKTILYIYIQHFFQILTKRESLMLKAIFHRTHKLELWYGVSCYVPLEGTFNDDFT